MKYDTADIHTGDYLLVDGRGMVSSIIEVVTGGYLSHVGVFFWEDGILKIAEMWEPNGYQDGPASARLPQIDGKMYIGVAPAIVREHPEGTLSVIAKYRSTPALQPYGFSTLPLVAAADNLDVVIAPDSIQSVCSIFGQQCAEACGEKFATLMSPADFAGFVAGMVPLEI